MPDSEVIPSADVIRLLRQWGRTWQIQGFESSVSVRYSPRLSRSLGRCNPREGTITLSASLPGDLVPMVLAHEAAHIAAFRLYGPKVKAHGPEWSGLLSGIGFKPAVRLVSQGQATIPGANNPLPTFRYAHQCPVCHRRWWARRQMHRWRCADCMAFGLEGLLTIIDTQPGKNPDDPR